MRARVFHAALVTGALFAAPGWAVTTDLPTVATVTSYYEAETIYRHEGVEIESHNDYVASGGGTLTYGEVAEANVFIPGTVSGNSVNMHAMQTVDGHSALAYQGQLAGGDQNATSTSRVTNVVTVQNNGPSQYLAMDVDINNIAVSIESGIGENVGNPFDHTNKDVLSHAVKLSYSVWGSEPTGGFKTYFESEATVWTYSDENTLYADFESDGDFIPILRPITYDTFLYGYDFLFPNITKEIYLGLFKANEVRSFSVSMSIETIQAPVESYMTASIADPFAVDGAARIVATSAPTPAVPLPAGAWLMFSGLGALGVARRARRARG